MTPTQVLKFGGTSLGSARRIERVGQIVADAAGNARVVVVVSAMGGVTSALAGTASLASKGDDTYLAALDRVMDSHEESLSVAIGEDDRERVRALVRAWGEELENRLHGVSLVHECSARTLDAILAFGELVSSALVAATLLRKGIGAEACDARSLIVTDDAFGRARVHRESTTPRVRDHFEATDSIQVVTGFIAANARGETTTLGRGGSDYTASLLAADLNADLLEIWTDVDGVMSADPRLVPQAFPLPTLSYEEIMELSHFGAKVIYPPSIHPAREQGIPLVIRNTFNVAFSGTRITDDVDQTVHGPVCGISSINDVALLRLEGDGMVGVPGVASRLFQALARAEVNVILISQASSEHSICFAVDPASVERARKTVATEFALERTVGIIDDLVVEGDLSILAAVGSAMRDTPGIAGQLFSTLGERGLNVHAIAQGSSERNISLVVARSDEQRALGALHDAFFKPRLTAQIFLAGVGQVGATLLAQIAATSEHRDTAGTTELVLAGMINSRVGVFDRKGIRLADWQTELEGSANSAEDMMAHVLEPTHGPRIFVDCTASEAIASRYEELLSSGASVVAANKLAFSGTMDRYDALAHAAVGGSRIYFETTVCAGLPVTRTIRDLVTTGDEIISVEGVFSGTLGFVLGEIMAGRSFTDAVADARSRGYTEPDPTTDLSGKDVVRKLLILARVSGMQLEPSEVSVQPLLSETDETFARRRSEALAQGRCLTYLGSVSRDGARVALTTVGPEHPCFGLRGTDNVIVLRSRRYPTPVVIRGAGAGPDVTAAGVLADILTAIKEAGGQ